MLNDHTKNFASQKNTSNGNVYYIPITILFRLLDTMKPYLKTIPKIHNKTMEQLTAIGIFFAGLGLLLGSFRIFWYVSLYEYKKIKLLI